MATIAPYIPESITVHLGSPDSNAENVTVSFSDYVKNVLSSEVYPTWEPAALRANALAIISFALNRIYTEYYRSRGYSFDITSSTAIDQKFINGRNIYENISELVDELFTDYLRKQGFVEPLAAKFCNGVTVTCSGLSQWGSQYLAQGGANSRCHPAVAIQAKLFLASGRPSFSRSVPAAYSAFITPLAFRIGTTCSVKLSKSPGSSGNIRLKPSAAPER